MRIRKLLMVSSLLATGACASVATQAGSGGSAGSVLTQAQLTATNSESLYDAIAKLRPNWLTSRGPTSMTDPTPTSASVYMNGSMLGAADYLRDMKAIDVTEVRYWDAGQASARFGMGHPRGVIEIVRK